MAFWGEDMSISLRERKKKKINSNLVSANDEEREIIGYLRIIKMLLIIPMVRMAEIP